MDSKKRKDILIIVMLIAVCFMSVAFASLSQKLEVSGTSTITGNWDVSIVSIEESATQGTGESLSASSDVTTTNFAASLNQPGDSVTYTVTVKNSGTIDAKLDSISSTSTPDAGTDDNPYIIYSYDGITSGSVLASGESITFTVTVQYSSEVDATTATAMEASLTTILNYVQA